MNDILNSTYEVSIRILIQLFVLDKEAKSSDYISSLDYLSLYSKTFGFGDYNLHGENPYRLGEFGSRLKTGRNALKLLVSCGLCSVITSNTGFAYTITESGENVVNLLNTPYTFAYLNNAIDTQEYFKNYNDVEIFEYINGVTKERR